MQGGSFLTKTKGLNLLKRPIRSRSSPFGERSSEERRHKEEAHQKIVVS
jgi:hypothetical protein